MQAVEHGHAGTALAMRRIGGAALMPKRQ